jgi:hypothetical protein
MTWKTILDYPDYEVSDYGFVRRKGHIFSPGIRNGYHFVNLSRNSKRKKYYVHRLVSMAFIPNPRCYKYVNHKDGVKTHNHIDNLEWCTASFNNAHAYRTGLKPKPVTHGQLNGMAKLTNERVIAMRNEYNASTTYASLGRKYGVDYYTVSDVIKRKTWKHI